eukprot:CAMPEP_0176474324 /NCGR_PEP_ID=MMETSP0127-20121128/42920_1 /TAXON_ID=938130 /ORGANISM="Platyophrya macrostoma, Strain WH" /LENGTH=297 /DNA_ID=CAMNT_0017869661 /DNA_START=500 /DNA_END=1393 /DNA_ORIENTATION=-
MNITGYDLNNWLQSDNNFSNYTSAGYYVALYQIQDQLKKGYDNGVYGRVSFRFFAFGNDSTDTNCSGQTKCRQIIDNWDGYLDVFVRESEAPTMQIDLDSCDQVCKVNCSDIQNFVVGYFYGVLVPFIIESYNLTNVTTNRTIYLPSYSNNTEVSIDCSEVSWNYCSGANPQSSLFFLGTAANNMSITVNRRGYGHFNGTLRVSYTANLINLTNTCEGKESLNDDFEGHASLYLSGPVSPKGSDSYIIQLNQQARAYAPFDRNSFVQNAVQHLYEDSLYLLLQNFVNNIFTNSIIYE